MTYKQPPAFDLLREARWEQEGIRRAAQRYREAAAAADPAALPSGQKLLREVVPKLTEKIVELQLRGVGGIRSSGRATLWAVPIQLLSADTMALITVTRALSGAEVPTEQAASVAGLAGDIARAVWDEVVYRQWIEEQAKANKEAREAKDWEHVDLLADFRRRYPNADKQSWGRYRKRLELAQSEPWEEETRIQLGTTLIHALVEAAPERFQVDTHALLGGRTQNYLRLSVETYSMMRDIESRAMVSRPMLMPMLIPPIPWKYEP